MLLDITRKRLFCDESYASTASTCTLKYEFWKVLPCMLDNSWQAAKPDSIYRSEAILQSKPCSTVSELRHYWEWTSHDVYRTKERLDLWKSQLLTEYLHSDLPAMAKLYTILTVSAVDEKIQIEVDHFAFAYPLHNHCTGFISLTAW